MKNHLSSLSCEPGAKVIVAICTFFFITMVPLSGLGQIEISFETTDNTNCNGSECDYDGPGILINEIMMSPVNNDGSLWGGLATQSGEWIELYNPDFCEPVDISCYYLGNNANDPLPYPGGYVIPAGTVVPPAGFVLIRGINAAPVPSDLLIENGGNTIELVVTGEGVCVGGGSRLWFPNAGGWFAFYDSFGEPQDAVTWANESNQNEFPCVPPLEGCNFQGQLPNYSQIPDDRKQNILTNSAAAFQGQSLRRIPDGGAWSDPSEPTYGFCNEDCVDPGASTCNGTATVVPATGSPEDYTYLWNDAQLQTTPTAVGLCTQEYCVVITDSLGNSTEECVIIEEPSFATERSDVFCEGDVYSLPDGSEVIEGGTYEVPLVTSSGCDSLVTLDLEMFPSYSFELNPEICENQSYTLPDGEEVDEEGTYIVNFVLESGCDSTYTVNLSVEPVLNIDQEFVICQGESVELPDGSFVEESGEYEVQIAGVDCDTLYTIDVNVNPSFDINNNVDLCIGESYQMPDGEMVNESGLYTVELVTAEGCDSIINTFLTINPLPVLSIPIAEVFCFQPGVIDVNPTPPGGTLSGVLVDGTELNLNAAPPGTYSLVYDYTDDNGCSNQTQHSYTVLPEIIPAFDFSADCFNIVEFDNLTIDPEEEYQYIWSINEDVFSTIPNPSYNYPEGGTYSVTLEATNAANCSYQVSQDIELEEGLKISAFQLPNIISPNGDPVNQFFRLMPDDNNCLQYQITIFNRWGKQVYEMSENSIPFSGVSESGTELDEGVYFYIFESPQVDCTNTAYEELCKGSVHVVR